MLEVEQLDYKYPFNLDLRPTSALHQKLIGRLMAMAKYSQTEMQKRYSKWDEITQKISAYAVLNEEEARLKAADNSKPIQVIVPMSHALLDTLLTYLMSTYGDGVIFRYLPVGPEDTTKAMLLELLIHTQVEKSKMLLDMYVQWRDAWSLGIGIVAPRWRERWGRKEMLVDDVYTSDVTGQQIVIGQKKASFRSMLFEGNVLDCVHPKHYFPDPAVSMHKIQDGEFVCILNERNYMSILEAERDDTNYFNGRHLRNRVTISRLRGDDVYTDAAYRVRDQKDKGGTQPVDVLSFFCNIIPAEWGVGKSVYPEKWLFEVAGDAILIRAQPLNLNHCMFPVAVCAPNFDGYTIAPISTLELTHELQVAIDWLYKSRLHNVRTSLNNRLVIDPYLARYDDAISGEPGGAIRIREHVWGRGVQNAVEQLPVSDVTASHWSDIGYANDIAQRSSGAVDTLQGVVRPSGERRSATEMRDTRMSAVSRLQKAAKLISLQSMRDLGLMLASHTQQFMTTDAYVRTAGDYLVELAKIYQNQDIIKVSPQDILIDYDVLPADATTPGGEYLPDLIQAFQLSHTIPQSAMAFDPVKQMLDIYRRAGVKDATKFIRADVQLLPDEQAVEKAMKLGAMPLQMTAPQARERDERL